MEKNNDLQNENQPLTLANLFGKSSKLWICIKGIFTLFLFFFSTYFAYIPIWLFDIDPATMSDETSIWLTFFSNIMLVLVLFLIYFKSLKKEWQTFRKDGLKNLDIGFKYWMIGLMVMVVSNVIINFVFVHNIAANEEAVQSMIKVSPWLMLINAGILAPITEEITFRKTFKDMIKNPYLFILISGILFGSLHVVSATNFFEFLYIIPYASLGIAFAFMYQKTNTVFTPIAMHFFHNTVLTLVSILPIIL